MGKLKKSEFLLENVRLKTVLVYPPISVVQPPPLGIPVLQGYLKHKHYKNIKVFDFNCIYTRFSIKNFFHFFNLRGISTINSCVKQFFPLKQEFPEWSLNRMLNLIAKDNSFCKKETRKINNMVKFIMNKNPDIIGISVIYPEQIFYSLLISKLVKKINKKVFVVLGGSQISKHIKHLVSKKELIKIVDGFIIGDGEIPLTRLIQHLNEKKSLDKLPNLYFKSSKKYARNKHTYFYNPKKTITPDFSGFKIENILPIRASVGCSWGKCTFCTYKNFHKKNIYSKPEEVITLIKILIKKYKVRRFLFIDDALNIKFLKIFLRLIIKEKIKISWVGSLCLQQELEDESFIKLISKSGCETLFLGLESIHPRILRLMNKPHTPEMAKNILKLLKKHKIHSNIHIIFGFPSETKEEAKVTYNFLINEKELYSKIVLHHFCLEDEVMILKHPKKLSIFKIYKGDKNFGERLGFYYKTNRGMTSKETGELIANLSTILKKEGKLIIQKDTPIK